MERGYSSWLVGAYIEGRIKEEMMGAVTTNHAEPTLLHAMF